MKSILQFFLLSILAHSALASNIQKVDAFVLSNVSLGTSQANIALASSHANQFIDNKQYVLMGTANSIAIDGKANISVAQ